MPNRTPRQSGSLSPARARCRRAGMTLIELLVVISIIVMLITLLVPSYSKVKDSMYRARSQARITELSTGATRYATDNKGLYPGQLNQDKLGNGANLVSGSQMLLGCLFFKSFDPTDAFNQIKNGDPNLGTALYAPYSKDDVIWDGTTHLWGIWDKYGQTTYRAVPPGHDPGEMAILYYPARVGESGLTQYHAPDNQLYTSNDYSTWLGNSFNAYITDRRVGATASTPPYNPGTFLLVGAGTDSKYGSPDDVKNFGN
jgi:prepilin-type N-terminal cleavage/methylation domain-containing protein